jgi:hypothetical protein
VTSSSSPPFSISDSGCSAAVKAVARPPDCFGRSGLLLLSASIERNAASSVSDRQASRVAIASLTAEHSTLNRKNAKNRPMATSTAGCPVIDGTGAPRLKATRR